MLLFFEIFFQLRWWFKIVQIISIDFQTSKKSSKKSSMNGPSYTTGSSAQEAFINYHQGGLLISGGVVESGPLLMGGVIEFRPLLIGGVIESGLIPCHLLAPTQVIINECCLKLFASKTLDANLQPIKQPIHSSPKEVHIDSPQFSR